MEKTNESIEKALMSLLEEKPLSKISVSEIARKAAIDRKTFYLRYGSPEEAFAALASNMVDSIMKGVQDDLSLMSNADVGSLNEREYFELVLKLFFGRVRLLYNEENIPAHRKRNVHSSIDSLFSYYIDPLTGYISSGVFGTAISKPKKARLAASMILISSLWLHTAWLNDGAGDSLNERSEEVCRILIDGLCAG